MVALATLTPPLSPAERVRGSPGPGISGPQNPPGVFPTAGTAPDPPPSHPCLMAARGPVPQDGGGQALKGGGREGTIGAAPVLPRCRSSALCSPFTAVLARFEMACRVQRQPPREPPNQQGRCSGHLVCLNFI